jgi:glycosyltransferase involved in cell wall biosynthesis
MKAIFFTSNYYESSLQVGDHHLARYFALNGWEVAFISSPISPLHLLRGRSAQLSERFSIYAEGGKSHLVGKGSIWSYVPGAIVVPKNLPVLRNLWIYENWHHLTLPNLSRRIKAKGFGDVDLLHIRDPKQMQWIETIKHKVSLYRLADFEAGFSHFDVTIDRMEKDLANKVDWVIYTAKSLKSFAENLKPDGTFFLPNGVDSRQIMIENPPPPPEFEHLSAPIAIYIGSIEYWFDFDLINQLTEKMESVEFVFIGPLSKSNVSKFIQRPNVHLLGSREYEEIGKYLYHADIALIPFNKGDYPELINAINPLKLYEYFAAGLPVVATRWRELEMLNSPAILCDTQIEFIQAIQNCLREATNKSRLVQFALEYDWSRIFERLQEKIRPYLQTQQK